MFPMRTIREIAAEIKQDWKEPYFGALPYIFAMQYLDYIDDRFGHDGAKDILSRFLSNAGGYRTKKAREIKDEIRSLLSS
jgi:hypothetical protein